MDKQRELSNILAQITIEPNSHRCRLVLDLSWEDLENLLSTVAPWINPLAAAQRRSKKARAESHARIDEKLREARSLGFHIDAALTELVETGLSNDQAWVEVAAEHNLSVDDAKVRAKLFRRERRLARDKAVISAAKKGLSLRQIAIRQSVSKSTVSNILSKYGVTAKTGAGA